MGSVEPSRASRRCVFCREELQPKWLGSGLDFRSVSVHVSTGKLECRTPPITAPVENERYYCRDSNVYEVGGKFIASLRDMVDVFLLNEDAENSTQ